MLERAACSTGCWSRIAPSLPTIPGTTRDLVSEVVAIDGIPIKFVDTAGIRPGQDLVETLGIERSYQAMADADLTLVVVDLSQAIEPDDLALIDRAKPKAGTFWWATSPICRAWLRVRMSLLAVSAVTGEGIERLREKIAPAGAREQDSGFITSIRHQQLLARKHRGAGASAESCGIRHPA